MAKKPSTKSVPVLSFDPIALRSAVLSESGARDAMWAALKDLAEKDDNAARDCIIEARMLHGLKLADTDANLAKVRAILAQSGRKLDKDGNPILNDAEGKPRRSEASEVAYSNARSYVRDWFKRIGLKRSPIGSGGARQPKADKAPPKDKAKPAKAAPAPMLAEVKDASAFMLQALNAAAALDVFAHKFAKVSPPKVVALISKFHKELEALAAT